MLFKGITALSFLFAALLFTVGDLVLWAAVLAFLGIWLGLAVLALQYVWYLHKLDGAWPSVRRAALCSPTFVPPKHGT